jgi:hypothetical protein
MKMETMAQFLIKGDLILSNRKKYKVLNVTTSGETTKILIKDKNINRIILSANNTFYKVISPIKID